jgi:hypothetical protein
MLVVGYVFAIRSRRPIPRPSGPAPTRGRHSSLTPIIYLIDVKFGVVVDVEGSQAIRQAEVGAARTMIERTEQRFGLSSNGLAGDTLRQSDILVATICVTRSPRAL